MVKKYDIFKTGVDRNDFFVNIYMLADPRKPEVARYIGKTRKLLIERLVEHLEESETKSTNNHRVNWIKSLLAINIVPEIYLIAIVKKKEWQKMECHYIKLFKSFGARLTNGTPGGDGGPVMCGEENPNFNGRTVTEYQRKVARQTIQRYCLKSEGFKQYVETGMKGNKYFAGKTHTEENKRKVGLANMGPKHTEEQKQKWSEERSGENHPLYGVPMKESTKNLISKSKKEYYQTEDGKAAVTKLSNDNKVRFKGEGNPFAGHEHTRETKDKISQAKIGKPAWNKGQKLTDEKYKTGGIKNKGRFAGDKNPMYNVPSPTTGTRFQWVNNGVTNQRWPLDKPLAEGLVKGMICNLYDNSGENHPSFGKRYQWITNGIENKHWSLEEEIPIGWKQGQTR